MMLYSWAPGDEGMALPNDVGFTLFDNTYNKAIHMQIHYNKMSSLGDSQTDSSGLRFYYTQKERAHQAGMLAIGDPQASLAGVKVDEGLTQYEFTCPGACSSWFLGEKAKEKNEGVTIVSERK